MEALSHRDQPSQRRNYPPLPDTAVPYRRSLRPRGRDLLHPDREALLLLRFGQPPEPCLQGPYPRRPRGHRGGQRPPLRRRIPTRRRVPPDRGPLPVRQAGDRLYRRQPRERPQVLQRHRGGPRPRGAALASPHPEHWYDCAENTIALAEEDGVDHVPYSEDDDKGREDYHHLADGG